MTELLLHNANVVTTTGIRPGGILIRDGRIVQVFDGDDKPAAVTMNDSIDLRGAYIAPGMIDIHIHGSVGVDLLNTDVQGLGKLSEFLLTQGVTGYFATLVPTDQTRYSFALREIDSFVALQQVSDNHAAQWARILGVHFEGPFVSHNRCGALQTRYFRTYDGNSDSLELFTSPPYPRLMTLAPEIEGGLDLIRHLSASGVRCLIGHTQADPDTLDLAVQAGARHVTHFPNALEPLHHRKPGAVAWGLVRHDVTVDCIVDLHHIHPLMLQVMYQAKTAERIALISDAIPPAGLGDGEFAFWDGKITVRGGLTSLAGAESNGPIAGSVITMLQAVRNTVGLGVPVGEALLMASLIPARAAGLNREYGSIEEGKRADIVVLDADLNVLLVAVGGALRLDRR